MKNAKCPNCGAPCTRHVNMRSGENGWSTTDEERAEYTYVGGDSAASSQRALVEALPAKWRKEAHGFGHKHFGHGLEQCADELTAALDAAGRGGG